MYSGKIAVPPGGGGIGIENMRMRSAHCERTVDRYTYFHWFNSSKLFYLTVNIFVVSQDAEFLCAVTSLCDKEHSYL
jgi:hypothetical protein